MALAAEVSLATASRVFSHPQLVRETTAQRVHDAARRLAFRPNLLGAKLRSQQPRILGVMLPTLENAVFAECWAGIEEVSLATGYSLMLVTSGYDPARERERVEYLLRHRVDGMVLTVSDAAQSAACSTSSTVKACPTCWPTTRPAPPAVGTRSPWTTAPVPARA